MSRLTVRPPQLTAGNTAAHRQRTAAIAGFGTIALGLVLMARILPVQRYFLDSITWILAAGWAGVTLFVVLYLAATVLFLPGSVLTLAAGFAYGVAWGTLIAWVAANLGAMVAFVLGRTFARHWVERRARLSPAFAALDAGVGRDGLRVVLLTRLSPILPYNLLNYAFGLTAVRFRDYALGSLVGMLPGTLMYVYVGSLITSLSQLSAGHRTASPAQMLWYLLGGAATVWLTIFLGRLARAALAEAHVRPGTAVPDDQAAPAPPLSPDDEPNRTLVAWTHPHDWSNPAPSGRYNLVVLGGGTAGLVAAAGAAGLGAKVALVEQHLLGGDCLHTGCVPSKALLSAARVAAAARAAGEFGVHVGQVEVDFPGVMARMRRLRAALAPHDSAIRLRELGVDVFFGPGRFLDPTTVEVDGRRLPFSRAVVATGARAASLGIPGLEATGYLTNETVFNLTELPRRLAVIGAGPVGCELAQAFRRFGSAVTLIEAEARVLPREDPDASAVLAQRLRAEGLELLLSASVHSVARRDTAVVVSCATETGRRDVLCDAILLGIGRAPNVEAIGLEAAGVSHGARGITVNDHLQTTNRRIYAAGDVASGYKFTHMADALARIVLANALFAGRRKASALHVPWCTYTQPEVAHVGLSQAEAAARGYAVDALTIPMHEVDRARLEGSAEGFLRLHLRRGTDRILGATLVADHAGETISELTAAMVAGRGLRTLAEVIHPYPTQAEIIKKAADAYNRRRLTPRLQRLLTWWLAVRR